MAFLIPVFSYAESSFGATDYSGLHANISNAEEVFVTYASLVVDLCYAIASILAIYSATIIYIKINTGEEGFAKSVITLIGACLFLIFSTMILPGFFGYSS